jgi:hypothetical protein
VSGVDSLPPELLARAEERRLRAVAEREAREADPRREPEPVSSESAVLSGSLLAVRGLFGEDELRGLHAQTGLPVLYLGADPRPLAEVLEALTEEELARLGFVRNDPSVATVPLDWLERVELAMRWDTAYPEKASLQEANAALARELALVRGELEGATERVGAALEVLNSRLGPGGAAAALELVRSALLG